MKLKEGVALLGVQPELCLGLIVANSIFENYGAELVVTSLVDSKHSAGSLHYAGAAADLRISNVLPSKLNNLVASLRTALGKDFDVVLEKDHIHMEFQPKKGVNLG